MFSRTVHTSRYNFKNFVKFTFWKKSDLAFMWRTNIFKLKWWLSTLLENITILLLIYKHNNIINNRHNLFTTYYRCDIFTTYYRPYNINYRLSNNIIYLQTQHYYYLFTDITIFLNKGTTIWIQVLYPYCWIKHLILITGAIYLLLIADKMLLITGATTVLHFYRCNNITTY